MAGAMAGAIVIRTINIAAQPATPVAQFIQGPRSSEGALLCEALQYVGGARMLPVVDAVRTSPIVAVHADGKRN